MYTIIKRFSDILLALILTFILSPIFIVVIITLKFTGEGEIFYLQERVGKKNKIFKIFKFVTMVKNSPHIGSGIYTSANDSRVLPFGKLLRKTKINELPQIFNVIIGDMSFVGPRPLIHRTFLLYNNDVQANIYNSRPGITGVGSIIFRDEDQILLKSKLPLEEFYSKHIAPYKGKLEIWYQKNISLMIDLKILFLTAVVILKPGTKIIDKILKNLPSKNTI
tara:strand:- start:4923 stop:5588 length:666 start_codon:yes stop_codon:yes gene_type:complete